MFKLHYSANFRHIVCIGVINPLPLKNTPPPFFFFLPTPPQISKLFFSEYTLRAVHTKRLQMTDRNLFSASVGFITQFSQYLSHRPCVWRVANERKKLLRNSHKYVYLLTFFLPIWLSASLSFFNYLVGCLSINQSINQSINKIFQEFILPYFHWDAVFLKTRA